MLTYACMVVMHGCDGGMADSCFDAGPVLQVVHDGAPPPGLAFLDWLVKSGAVRSAECSFPRMGKAAGGLATCPVLGELV